MTAITALTPRAQAQYAALTALLAELSLTPDQAHALLLAPGFAEEAQTTSVDEEVRLSWWQEDGHSAWADVICEIPGFLLPRE